MDGLSLSLGPAQAVYMTEMAQTVYVVQTFEMRRARLVPTLQEPATTAERARRCARRTAESKGGAIAIEMMIDEDTGAIDSSRILERFSNVPDDLDGC
jgi:hypothetical protein